MVVVVPNQILTGTFVLSDKYRIERLLGAGRFSQVYLATHVGLDRPQVLKLIGRTLSVTDLHAAADYRRRFQFECKLASRFVGHPQVAQVFDTDELDGWPVLIMEWAQRGSLQHELDTISQQSKHNSIQRCTHVLLDIADGLAALHAVGYVHRDVKPDNVLVYADDRVKVSDFGLAQSDAEPSIDRFNTQAAKHPGTRGYMSPEHDFSAAQLTAAADVYALGALGYKMLTGRLPANPDLAGAPRDLRADTPRWLNDLIVASLRTDPRQRPADGSAFADAIRAQPSLGTSRKWTTRESDGISRPPASHPFSETVRFISADRIEITIAPSVRVAFVRVSAGSFLMGSDEAKDRKARKDEVPQHPIRLPEYWIGWAPITLAEYAAFYPAANGAMKQKDAALRARHPMVDVTWDDAQAFCEWATKIAGLEICLPSEAEWEKAARGPNGRRYPWGSDPPSTERATYDNNGGGTTEVGKHNPRWASFYGCVDMAGNVWEWTRSLWGPDAAAPEYSYPYSSRTSDREDLAAGRDVLRVLRGGSYAVTDTGLLRCAFRFRMRPDEHNPFSGFRVVARLPDNS